jgi:hypothetical protein
LLPGGVRFWMAKKLGTLLNCERDEDIFHVQYVLPLRQLRDEDKIDGIAEGGEIGSRGTTRIFIRAASILSLRKDV